MTDPSHHRIGLLIRDAREHRGLTQSQLAEALQTSPGELNQIERGTGEISMELVARISEALDAQLVPPAGRAGPTHLRVVGGRRLGGAIDVRTSKNACVGLLCAALLNSGRTVLRKVARIEEVFRLLEVLNSLGVSARWINEDTDLEIHTPARLRLEDIDVEAARRTRSIIMFLGPLLHRADRFRIPYAGGCDLGTRTVHPHMNALRHFGLEVTATEGTYHAEVDREVTPARPIVLTERGDTVTENVLLAAALHDGVTVIRNASSNYMVQDLCFFLEQLGVRIEGVGTTSLTVYGRPYIEEDVDYSPSEDPVEAMSLLTAAVVTDSELTVRRVPVEFLEVELAVLEEMGLDHDRGREYRTDNGRTRLVDLTVRPSKLRAPVDKVHPMPFPGLNIDNVPFFAALAAVAQGQTLIHDWVYDNRAIYLADLNRLGARLQLLDPHRVLVEGPTRWRAAEMMCPPALRPAVVVLLGMMAAEGTSVLRNVYVINRGYEDLARRLNQVGARIEIFQDR
ncbi:UDP-N-acetylglucosamine 1-carboxyvinyltransferase [Streptomyces sp. NPDC005438]|uniref:helix-turn-helix domain-containing protein n=1 Tax=Streptomyces sp. NPDC005438 TaxID=3156880 RepID=UPI0033AC5F1F